MIKNTAALILGALSAVLAALDPLKHVKRRLAALESDLETLRADFDRQHAESKRRIDYMLTDVQALRADLRESKPYTLYQQTKRRA